MKKDSSYQALEILVRNLEKALIESGLTASIQDGEIVIRERASAKVILVREGKCWMDNFAFSLWRS